MTLTHSLGRTVFLSPAERLLAGRTPADAVRGRGPGAWAELDRHVALYTHPGPSGTSRIRVGPRWFDKREVADWSTAPRWDGERAITFAALPPHESEVALALCHGDPLVREHALEHVAGRPGVLPLVLLRCADTVGAVRERARAVLAAAPPEAVDGLLPLALLTGLRRHGDWARRLLVDRLGRAPAAAVAELLEDTDEEPRYAGVVTAARYGLLAPRRAAALAAGDPSARIRQAVLDSGVLPSDTVDAHGSAEALDALAAAAPDFVVRRAALDLVLADPACTPGRLLGLAGAARDRRVRIRAVAAVRASRGPEPLAVPAEFAASPYPSLRLLAAEELARARRTDELVPYLDDPAGPVRAAARAGLLAAGRNPYDRYRDAASWSLPAGGVLGMAECGDPSDSYRLRRLTGHPDGTVRAAALSSLRRRGAAGVEVLLPFLADPDPKAVRAVRRPVLAYGDALPEAELAALTAWSRPPEVRRAALVLLDRRPLVVRRRVARALHRHRDPVVRAWAREQTHRPLSWTPSAGRDAARAIAERGVPLREVLEVEDPAAWTALDLGTRSYGGYAPDWLRVPAPTALCHPSGRVREAALARAAGDPELLPLVVLRCADWVAPVREAARALLAQALAADPAGTLRALTPVVLHVSGRERGAWALARFEEALRAPEAAQVRAALLAGTDREARRFAARTLPADGTSPAAELARRAAAEADALLRTRWTGAALALMAAQGTDAGAVEALLGAQAGDVRAAGVTALRAAGRAGEAARYLTDRSARVRSCARWLLRQGGGDPRAAYRALVAADPVPRAVVGLAECGAAADASVLAPLLGHPDGAVRAAAVTGLALLDAAPAPELLPLLDDPSPAVARAARRALYGSAGTLPADALLERCAAGRAPHTRREALRLLARQGTARGLCAAAGLLADPDPELRAVAGRMVRSWDWSEARDRYPEVLPELRRLLGRYQAEFDAGEVGRIRRALRSV
ncbi:HEAT repeat domain-containing protein [Streptomyces sp. NPDC101118]|uniref:HEAT repeat domain-containing protein n=1 Tax=Streptomyces sp. NPDC101118 TaxID=3366109 RepID=UPI00380BAF36